MAVKSKVLSVRLSLESLQSCFDLCEALGSPTNGASGAIARSVEVLTRDLREKGTLPTYRPVELESLLEGFLSRKNPTSMMSLESLGNIERTIDRRDSASYLNGEDFAPSYRTPPTVRYEKVEETLEEQSRSTELHKQELDSILEESIKQTLLDEEANLLSKIMIHS